MWDSIQTSFACTTLEVTKLDGTTAGQPEAVTSFAGQSTGDIVPAASGVLSLHTAQRGPRGRGRLYLGPPGEGIIATGQLASGTPANIAGAWATFNAAMAADGFFHCVASYVHADSHDITSYRCDTLLGTQRRRQDQLR
jgi:hypothetical protein